MVMVNGAVNIVASAHESIVYVTISRRYQRTFVAKAEYG